MAAAHTEEMNSSTGSTAPMTILKTSAKPITPRTKRRPSVTFKLPIENDDAEEAAIATATPSAILANDGPTAFVPTTEAVNRKQREQVASLTPRDNHDEGDNSIVPIDNDEIKANHNGTWATVEVADEENVAHALMAEPEASVLKIADVTVKPFVAKQTSAQTPVAPVFIDETHRQFSNPISYLGGPMLKTRNRHSISSILSLD